MIRIYDSKELSMEEIANRSGEPLVDVSPEVDQILEDVKRRGDGALYELTARFDGVDLSSLLVTTEEWEQGASQVDPVFLETMEVAKRHIETFHKHQIRNSFIIQEDEGVILGQKVMAMERVGMYVPGGTACYPSSVLMNAIPAKLAGVNDIIMVTPPNKAGSVAPALLAAARIAGVTQIVKCGGAQSIAALAFGTESVPKVDKIVGPGNVYVATAKRKVFGLVDIDMIAGPSEILVIADESSDPRYVAADLLSQAEHDSMAGAILITNSASLAQEVAVQLERQLPLLSRKDTAEESIRTRGKIIRTQTIKEAIDIANAIAPEHLELCVADPFAVLSLVKNAGSIFLGHFAPEALGDYFAGPNHVLPTGGTARFSSPLSVDDFIRKSSFVYYTKDALAKVKDQVVLFASEEGLEAHGKSVSIRFDAEKK